MLSWARGVRLLSCMMHDTRPRIPKWVLAARIFMQLKRSWCSYGDTAKKRTVLYYTVLAQQRSRVSLCGVRQGGWDLSVESTFGPGITLLFRSNDRETLSFPHQRATPRCRQIGTRFCYPGNGFTVPFPDQLFAEGGQMLRLSTKLTVAGIDAEARKWSGERVWRKATQAEGALYLGDGRPLRACVQRLE